MLFEHPGRKGVGNQYNSWTGKVEQLHCELNLALAKMI